MNAIVISLGGLHAGTLGCYGGEWVDTTAIDRLAANAFVFDRCYVECPCPKATRRNWWTGCLQYSQTGNRQQAVAAGTSLTAALRSQGVRTVLIRDTTALVPRSELVAASFEQVNEIERDQYDATHKVFEIAARWLLDQASDGPFLLFLDCHGAHPPWLATDQTNDDRHAVDPAYCSSEDDGIGNEDNDTGSESDMHESSGSDQNSATDQEIECYLTATRHIDGQVGRFLDQLLASQELQRSLLVMTSDVGCSVGTSAAADAAQFDLGESRIHVPLLMRYPGAEPARRSSALVQPIDLVPTVLDAIGVAVPGPMDGRSLLPICRLERMGVRDVARLTQPGGQQAIRTANWYLVRTQGTPVDFETTGAAGTKLFVKPDDRWERNDVAKQYPEVIAELTRLW